MGDWGTPGGEDNLKDLKQSKCYKASEQGKKKRGGKKTTIRTTIQGRPVQKFPWKSTESSSFNISNSNASKKKRGGVKKKNNRGKGGEKDRHKEKEGKREQV